MRFAVCDHISGKNSSNYSKVNLRETKSCDCGGSGGCTYMCASLPVLYRYKYALFYYIYDKERIWT